MKIDRIDIIGSNGNDGEHYPSRSYTLTPDRIKEMVQCILECELDFDEAVDYAIKFAGECRDDAQDVVDGQYTDNTNYFGEGVR